MCWFTELFFFAECDGVFVREKSIAMAQAPIVGTWFAWWRGPSLRASLRPWCKNARCFGGPGPGRNKVYGSGFSLMIVVVSWCIESNIVQLWLFPLETLSNINIIMSINCEPSLLQFLIPHPTRSLLIDPPVREPRTRGVDATGRETHQGGTGRIWRCTVWSVCGGVANLWRREMYSFCWDSIYPFVFRSPLEGE